MGSVKNLIRDDSPAGKLYQAPTPHEFGIGGWDTTGNFSVGDLKNRIPATKIDSKGPALAMSTGAYFEHAANNGLESCYVGMMDKDGEIVHTNVLLDRGETSNIVVMKLANAPNSSETKDVEAYHKAIKDGDISVYVADAESIFRAGLPLGSSSFKKMAQMAGMGDGYEKVATYDDTVAFLDKVRETVEGMGWSKFRELETYITNLGLDRIPNPGTMLPEPVLNFTTKFDIAGDQDVTEEQARERMGVTPEQYEQWKDIVQSCAANQIAYCEEREVVNIDGKVEAVVDGGKIMLTDFACTPDENRLMLRHGGLLIPTNKEIQRAIFRDRGIYDAIDSAKQAAEAHDGSANSWRNHLMHFTTQETLEEATEESCRMMGDAIKVVANRLLGKDIFPARPIDEWVGPFLPYASRVQQ